MAATTLVEICIASVEDAINSAAAGAARLELNSALALGGLTPSLGMLIEVRHAVDLPIVAMARPRAGGFCYCERDFRVLQRDVDLLLEHGADGIAFGILTADGAVDEPRSRQVVRQLGGAAEGAVFHRAFDFTPDPFAALEQLIGLGIRRVMTSGQQPTALLGAALIADLIECASGRIEILPAAGIRPGNVHDLLARTGCTQVHASLRDRRCDPSLQGATHIPLEIREGKQPGEYEVTRLRLLEELMDALDEPVVPATQSQTNLIDRIFPIPADVGAMKSR